MSLNRRNWQPFRAMGLVLVLAIVATPALALADEVGGEGFVVAQSNEQIRYNAAYGAAAALSSLVYGPVKTAFALGSLVAGGFAYAFTLGDVVTTRKVVGPAITGDYVITRHHIKGDRSIEFLGAGPF